LKKYSLDVADVSLDNLEKNIVRLEKKIARFRTDGLFENLRCRVECSKQEIFKAKKLGFSKIVINTSLDPFASVHDKLKLTEHVLQTVCSSDQEIYISIDNALEFPVEEVNIVSLIDGVREEESNI
jgi:homocitrate synthase NifV